MDPLLISNLAEATQVDGIYIFSTPPPGYVRGTGTSIVGIVGEFERGPVDTVLSVGSSAEFTETLGGYGTAPSGSETTWRGYSGYRAIAGKQWPAGLRIIRVSRTDMAQATANIDLVTATTPATGRSLTVKAKYKGAYGNAIRVTIDTATDASLTNGFRLTIADGTRSETIDNLYAAMTPAQLAAAVAANNLRLVELTIADETPSTKGAWPATVALTSGSDGTANADSWTGAIAKLLARKEVKILFYAEPDGTTVTTAALNAAIKAAVAPSSGGSPLVRAILHGPAGDDIDDAALAAASNRSSRLTYTWPWRKQYFAEAVTHHPNGFLLVPSADVMAAALAAIDPVYDPTSSFGTNIVNAATVGLEFDDLNRDDYVTANRNGVAAIELDSDLGFRFRSGITTSLVPGLEMIHRQRLEDYFVESIANSLKAYQGLPITQAWKDAVVGAVTGFFETQKTLSPYPRVLEYLVDIESVNSPTTEAQGLFNIRLLVRTPASARFIVLLSQVGSTVTVTTQQ